MGGGEGAVQGTGDPKAAKDASEKAADLNGLSNTYGFVRGKERALLTATARD